MTPYYQRNNITIYHCDSREILPSMSNVDLLLTDPPYGIDGARGVGNRKRGKAKYQHTTWDDTPEYIDDVVLPIIGQSIEKSNRGIITPGKRHAFRYPTPADMGCFWTPAGIGVSPWGLTAFHIILFYGADPRAGRGGWPTGKMVTERAADNGHPCPKPIKAWQWLLAKGSVKDTDVIFDPFMGSGTTLVAAKNMGRHAIGVEIEEAYCEIAAKGLEQEVMDLNS